MPRRLVIVAAAVLVIAAVAVAVVLAVNRSPKLQNTLSKVANLNAPAANVNAALNANTGATATPDETTIRYVARNFAEQYGSGSNENDFANLVLAQRWGTKNFNDYLNRSISQQRAALKMTPFHSIVTQALVIDVTTQNTATASVTVTTQRTETIDRAVKTYYQDLLLNLLKDGGTWKIDAASWKPV